MVDESATSDTTSNRSTTSNNNEHQNQRHSHSQTKFSGSSIPASIPSSTSSSSLSLANTLDREESTTHILVSDPDDLTENLSLASASIHSSIPSLHSVVVIPDLDAPCTEEQNTNSNKKKNAVMETAAAQFQADGELSPDFIAQMMNRRNTRKPGTSGATSNTTSNSQPTTTTTSNAVVDIPTEVTMASAPAPAPDASQFQTNGELSPDWIASMMGKRGGGAANPQESNNNNNNPLASRMMTMDRDENNLLEDSDEPSSSGMSSSMFDYEDESSLDSEDERLLQETTRILRASKVHKWDYETVKKSHNQQEEEDAAQDYGRTESIHNLEDLVEREMSQRSDSDFFMEDQTENTGDGGDIDIDDDENSDYGLGLAEKREQRMETQHSTRSMRSMASSKKSVTSILRKRSSYNQPAAMTGVTITTTLPPTKTTSSSSSPSSSATAPTTQSLQSSSTQQDTTPTSLQKPEQAPKKKRLRFATNPKQNNRVWCLVRYYEKFDPEYKKYLWWSKKDLKKIYKQHYQDLDEETEEEYGEALLKAYDSVPYFRPDLVDPNFHLSDFISCGEARGMEQAVYEIGDHVQKHREEVMAVWKFICNPPEDGFTLDSELKDELLGLKSLKFSHPSRMMAHKIAQFDHQILELYAKQARMTKSQDSSNSLYSLYDDSSMSSRSLSSMASSKSRGKEE